MKNLLIAVSAVAMLSASAANASDNGYIWIDQVGVEHTAGVSQNGYSNEGMVAQAGEDNLADVWQIGNENRAEVIQRDRATAMGADGSTAHGNVQLDQFGSYNDSRVVQIGNSNFNATSQTGDNNYIMSYTDGNYSSNTVNQTGRGNVGWAWQAGPHAY